MFTPRNSQRQSLCLSHSFSFSTYVSAKLHDSHTGQVILLKGWSLCTLGLEQHRLSSEKNPRKSFLPFSVSAKRRWHFPRGTNPSLFRTLFRTPSPLIYFTPLSHSPFHSFCLYLVNLSSGSRLEADGKAGK